MTAKFRGVSGCGDGCCYDVEDYDTLAEAMRWHGSVYIPGGPHIAKNYMGHRGWWVIDELLRPVRPFDIGNRCVLCGRLATINGNPETVIAVTEGFRHGVCDDRWDW